MSARGCQVTRSKFHSRYESFEEPTVLTEAMEHNRMIIDVGCDGAGLGLERKQVQRTFSIE